MYESFSQEVKNEICAVKTKLSCCRKALLYGMIFGASVYTEAELRFDTENPTVALQYARLIKEMTGWKKESDLSLSLITGKDKLEQLLDSLGTSFDREVPDLSLIRCQFCPWSFVKGVFLSCGTITSPGNSYHMEFLLRNEAWASAFADFLTELGAPPKLTERRNGLYGVYYKDSENVVDILGHFGANRAAFRLLDVKIYKDLRNNANRVANCEAANIGKTVAASNEQMRAIERIIASGKAEELPEELRQTLDLRAAFPNATLLELAAMHQPPITKSGVNHRLKRLISFSQTLTVTETSTQ